MFSSSAENWADGFHAAWQETNDDTLRIGIERPGRGVIVLRASGVLDQLQVARFAEVVRSRLRSTTPTLVLDLSELSFLSADGVAALLEANSLAKVDDKRLVLVTGVRVVDRPLEALEVADQFTYGGGNVVAESMRDKPVIEQSVPDPGSRTGEFVVAEAEPSGAAPVMTAGSTG